MSSKKSKQQKDQDANEDGREGGGSESLSIEETNKLRASLGLKPLAVDSGNEKTKSEELSSSGNKKYIDDKTSQEFEHVPAKNIADEKQQKEFKKKLEEQREKRRLVEKLSKSKVADEVDDSDLSTDVWLQKLKEKQEAAKRAKLFEEADSMLQADISAKKSSYSSKDLKGMRIEHDEGVFQEGREVILTLKDRKILKGLGDNMNIDEDEDADVLVNVNLLDNEKAAKNLDNKKRKPEYNPYEDDFDDDGNFRVRSVLGKYDEEMEGEKKKSFRLGARGEFDASDAMFINKLNEEHKARALNLDLKEFNVASDYFTQSEMEAFKKPKKVRKVLRKSKALKADDLLPLPDESVKPKKEKVESHAEKTDKKPSLKDLEANLRKNENEDEEMNQATSDDDDDEVDWSKLDPKNDQLKSIIDEENNALNELHNILNKTRQKIIKETNVLENLSEQLATKEEPVMSESVTLDNLNTIREDNEEEDNKGVVLDSLSEFCKNIGQGSTRRANNIYEDDEEADEGDKAEKRHDGAAAHKDESSSEDEFDQMEVESDHDNSDHNNDEEGFGILNDEPVLDKGLGSALKLAMSKGYLNKEQEKRDASARIVQTSGDSLKAKSITVEEKHYYDIDAKYDRNNRDRFSGPLSEFSEKKGYKPDVKIDYIDEKGKAMNEKEAFRYLSHRFHGKGSGKKKTEKRIRKEEESEMMKKMSSGDTPLNTVSLLIDKQKRTQQPYVVLSAPKSGKQDQVTLHKR